MHELTLDEIDTVAGGIAWYYDPNGCTPLPIEDLYTKPSAGSAE